jgi:hypothetical protein
MADDAHLARDTDKAGDDPVRELLTTCDRAPQEGLAWIDHLDDDLKAKPMIMFARFIALRHLAIDGFFADGPTELGGARAETIANVMDAQNRAHATQALAQVADIETLHPDYIGALGDPDDRFGERMVDDICIVNERLVAGSIQRTLGWTRLHFFGGERLGELPGVPEDPFTSVAIRMKLCPPQIARSAIRVVGSTDGLGRRYADFFLMEENFKTTPTIGDANMFCSARFFEDGEVAISPMDSEPESDAGDDQHGPERVGTPEPTDARASVQRRSGWRGWLGRR